MNSRATNSTMAMAADTVIVEVEEIVEVGELGPEGDRCSSTCDRYDL